MQSRTDLLEKAIEAHGGLARWQSAGEVRAKVSGGGFGFAAKFPASPAKPRGALRGEARVSTATPRTILAHTPVLAGAGCSRPISSASSPRTGKC